MTYSPLLEGFLLGVIATSSLVAGIFFLRFWRDTHDSLFLAFALAFAIEGVNRGFRIFFAHPSEASPWVFLVRAFAFLIILAGIVNKNRRSGA
ncbi:MAG TPA: DUF5985 family protein [Acidobacteriaceae bacterium]|jgi:uncharacterized membrane protein HdeD (DUF308 family)|nr:DUF5985 family protein [Acidobacteriaceae bacterium]